MTIKITEELVLATIEEAKVAGNNAIEDFYKRNGNVDSGTCGFATIAGLCGRKRKLKTWLESNGVRIDNWGGRHKNVFDIKTTVPITTQNIRIHEDVARAHVKVFNKNLGLELFVHSWVD